MGFTTVGVARALTACRACGPVGLGRAAPKFNKPLRIASAQRASLCPLLPVRASARWRAAGSDSRANATVAGSRLLHHLRSGSDRHRREAGARLLAAKRTTEQHQADSSH